MISSAEAQNMLIQETTNYALNVALTELPIRQAFQQGHNVNESTLPGDFDPVSGAYRSRWICGDKVASKHI